MLNAAGVLLLPFWVSSSIHGVCVWVFGAAVAVLMAMICKSERIVAAAAAAVEASCWSFSRSCCFSLFCVWEVDTESSG